MRRITTEEFIQKAKKIHGDKYDYSKVQYENSRKKVCIVCHKHGEFLQSPNNHLRGNGCPKCAIDNWYYNTEKFIQKAKKIHGDKYDYGKVQYENNEKKVCIVCREHGEFLQSPSGHLRGNGCPKCAIDSQYLGIEKFIQKSKKIHGDKYDYNKVQYENVQKKVCIICHKHGEFLQSPRSHLSGRGCPKCAIDSKHHDTEEFIQKAKKIHGDKYDYSKVQYGNNEKKVCIVCREHGEFLQSPHSHLSGCGCPQCAIDNWYYNTEKFIQNAKEIHGDKYDYSKVQYEHSQKKVCIICHKHGEFLQSPCNHLRGRGCPQCAIDSRHYNTEKFIQNAKEIHGDKYDYSKVQYENIEKKVCIICHKHGKFLQSPNNHLRGSGCPKCNSSKLETRVAEILNKNSIEFEAQKRFNFLGRKSLDFYLSEYNIAVECQGGQHFLAIEHFGGEKGLNYRIKNDFDKYITCKKHNIRILYFADEASYIPDGVITDEKVLLQTIKGEIGMSEKIYIQELLAG